MFDSDSTSSNAHSHLTSSPSSPAHRSYAASSSTSTTGSPSRAFAMPTTNMTSSVNAAHGDSRSSGVIGRSGSLIKPRLSSAPTANLIIPPLEQNVQELTSKDGYDEQYARTGGSFSLVPQSPVFTSSMSSTTGTGVNGRGSSSSSSGGGSDGVVDDEIVDIQTDVKTNIW